MSEANLVDNQDQPVVADNPAPQADVPVADPTPSFAWKDSITPDLRTSPSLQKFEDSPEGLNKAMESYHNLEKLLGHEKVPIPKGPDDTEGWTRFSKAMGIPDQADAYGLADADIPESMQNLTFDKNKFAEVVHAHKLTKDQANGLWQAYTELNKDSYAKAIEGHDKEMSQVINQLRGEWGDAYEGNIQLGQMVIEKFAGDQAMEDWLTTTLAKNPMGSKFLAKIGNQFAENKVGSFSYQRFSQSGEQAEQEIAQIMGDKNHAYHNEDIAIRQPAIDYVNSLTAIAQKAKKG